MATEPTGPHGLVVENEAVTAQLVLLDLDGTLYEAGRAVPGASQALGRMRAAGHTLRYFTNTDSQATLALLAWLRGIGLAIDARELFTPVGAARQVLARLDEPGVLLFPGT